MRVFFFHNVFPLFYLLREEAQVRCSVRRVSSAMFFRTQHNFLTVCLTFCCGRDLCSYFCLLQVKERIQCRYIKWLES